MSVNTAQITDLYTPSAPMAITPGNEYNAPIGSFPSQESIYIGEQDTNRLARANNVQATYVAARDSTRVTNIPIALSLNTWEQPPAAYNALYPYNHVRQTTNGLIEEFDDSPNAVRYNRQHPSGTFVEVDNDGTEVRRIVGDNYQIIDRDGNLYIQGSCNITIEGSCNILVKTDCNLQVDGNLTGMIKNDVSLSISGNAIINAKEDMKLKAENFTLEANRADFIVRDDIRVQTKNKHETISEKWKIQSDSIDITNAQKYTIKSTSYSLDLTGNFVVKSAAASVDTTGNIILDGSTLFLNSTNVQGAGSVIQKETQGDNIFVLGTVGSAAALAPDAPEVPTAPDRTGLIAPSQRATTNNPRPVPLPRFNRTEALAAAHDEGPRPATALWRGYNSTPPAINTAATVVPSPTPNTNYNVGYYRTLAEAQEGAARYRSAADFVRSNPNLYTPEEQRAAFRLEAAAAAEVQRLSSNNATPNVASTAVLASPSLVASAPSADEQTLLTRTNFEDSLVLSRYFNLGRVSRFAPASRHEVRAQKGLTAGQIVVNLRAICVNVLDKLCDQYGNDNILVTSGFRIGENQAQHGLGQAIDIQFRDIQNEAYFDRVSEIARIVPYDVILLEYKNVGTRNPWMHISFNRSGNRSIQRTYFNHEQVATGFVNLQPAINRQETTQNILRQLASRSEAELRVLRQSVNNL
jgi:hypothetical protein